MLEFYVLRSSHTRFGNDTWWCRELPTAKRLSFVIKVDNCLSALAVKACCSVLI